MKPAHSATTEATHSTMKATHSAVETTATPLS
jgi:hypothetical protein